MASAYAACAAVEVARRPSTPSPSSAAAPPRARSSSVGRAVERRSCACAIVAPDVAAHQRQRRPGTSRSAPGSRAELVLVDDDHARLGGRSRPAPPASQRSASVEPRLDARRPRRSTSGADERDARAPAGPRRRSSGSASSQRRRVASWRLAAQRRDGQLDQVGRALEVPAGQGVPDRLGGARRARSNQSLARRWSSGDPLGLLVEQARPQDVGEQVVVAVPAARSSSGTRNRFARSSASSMAVPPSPPGRRRRTATRVSRSRIDVSSRKRRTSVGLPLEHLLDEVVDDVAVVAGEAGDERARRRRGPAATAPRAAGRRSSPRSAPRARRRRPAPGPAPSAR